MKRNPGAEPPSETGAYRARGALLARTNTSDIYEWGHSGVLKVRRDGRRDLANRERLAGRAVHAAGLPAPRMGGLVMVEGRPGLVQERVHGDSMSRILGREPSAAVAMGRAMAGLQARLHACALPQLPSQRERLWEVAANPALPRALRPGVCRLLERLPDDRRVCHGDLNGGNVLITATGPVAIDWETAVAGHPLVDAAGVVLKAWERPAEREAAHAWRAQRGAFRRAYLREYVRLCPHAASPLHPWLAAAAVLSLPSVEDPWYRALLLRLVRAGTRPGCGAASAGGG